MKFSDLPLKPTPRALRQFATGWLILFLGLAARQGSTRGHTTARCVLVVMALIGIAGLLRPASVRWLFVGATVVTFPFGWVVTQAVLALMFYLVLTPVALLYRWRGRDALQLRRRAEQSSFWTTRGEPPPPAKYLKQF